jgi:hypothetical protein
LTDYQLEALLIAIGALTVVMLQVGRSIEARLEYTSDQLDRRFEGFDSVEMGLLRFLSTGGGYGSFRNECRVS